MTEDIDAADLSPLNIARRFTADGIRLFPCAPRSKKPAMSAWQMRETPTDAELVAWTEAGNNIAIIGGSDLVIIDVDGPAAKAHLDKLEAEHGPLPPTYRVTTGRENGGEHIYFWQSWPLAPFCFIGFPGTRTTPDGKDDLLEFRTANHYCMAEGSIHPDTGATYTGNGLPIADLPSWLCDGLPGARKPAAEKKKKTADDPFPAFLEKLQAHAGEGCSTDPDDWYPPATREKIESAIAAIPNDDLTWEEWNRIGMAIFAATDGEGLDAFVEWSGKSGKFNHRATVKRWEHYFRSPPTQLTEGTIFYEAQKAGWQWTEEKPEAKEPEKPRTKKLLVSSTDFVRDFIPPEYLIDGIVRRSFLYSMTAPTGGGKTAVALTLAAHIATGKPILDNPVEKGRALFMAGENVEDVQARWIGLCEDRQIDPGDDMVFMPGIEKLSDDKFRKLLAEEATEFGEFSLVFVDTSAAYSEAEEENSNAEMGAHARVLRSLIDLIPGRPTVIALCHPTKNANMENLLPRGGGAFLCEVDGNLVCKLMSASLVDLHWHGKFRGVEFAPVSFELRTIKSQLLKDAKGRIIPTVLAAAITDEEKENIGQRRKETYRKLIAVLEHDPSLSLAKIAEALQWFQKKDGKPAKTAVNRAITEMKVRGYIKRDGDADFEITAKGKKLLEPPETI